MTIIEYIPVGQFIVVVLVIFVFVGNILINRRKG